MQNYVEGTSKEDVKSFEGPPFWLWMFRFHLVLYREYLWIKNGIGDTFYTYIASILRKIGYFSIYTRKNRAVDTEMLDFEYLDYKIFYIDTFKKSFAVKWAKKVSWEKEKLHGYARCGYRQ